MRQRLSVILALLAPLPACKTTHQAADVKLIGGELSDAAELPGAVFMRLGARACSGTKITDKLVVTAMHCVIDDKLNDLVPELYDSPYKGFRISTDTNISPSSGQAVTARRVWVHPSFFEKCKGSGEFGGCFGGAQVFADLAVIELAEPTPTIVAARLSTADIPADKPELTMAGWGCETPVRVSPSPPPRLKKAPANLVGPDGVDDATVKGRMQGSVENYFFSAGMGISPTNATVCPGDSGGPVFLKTGGGLVLVGVNSSKDPNGVVQFHARLDKTRGLKAGVWLQNIVDGKEKVRPLSKLSQRIATGTRVAYPPNGGAPKTTAIAKAPQRTFVTRVTPSNPLCLGWVFDPAVKWTLFSATDDANAIVSSANFAFPHVVLQVGYYFIKVDAADSAARDYTMATTFDSNLSACDPPLPPTTTEPPPIPPAEE